MNYEAIKNYVLNAIAERFCTVEGMKKFIEPQIKAEIDQDNLEAVLYRMRSEGDIVMLDNGAFSAYFHRENQPLRFFRAGSGQINAIYDPKLVGEGGGLRNDPTPPDFNAQTWIEDIFITPYYTPEELKRIEDLTAEGASRTEIADEMEIDFQTLTRRARHDLPTRQAISEGHKRRSAKVQPAELQKAPVIADQPQPKPRVRVVDIRPEARVLPRMEIVDVEETKKTPAERQHAPLFERLCGCGNPLGARVKECRECWLLSKQNKNAAQTETPSAADRNIKKYIAESNLDPARINEILTDLLIKVAPDRVKEQFVQELWERFIESSRLAA